MSAIEGFDWRMAARLTGWEPIRILAGFFALGPAKPAPARVKQEGD
jgi:hypothetical protein